MSKRVASHPQEKQGRSLSVLQRAGTRWKKVLLPWFPRLVVWIKRKCFLGSFWLKDSDPSAGCEKEILSKLDRPYLLTVVAERGRFFKRTTHSNIGVFRDDLGRGGRGQDHDD